MSRDQGVAMSKGPRERPVAVSARPFVRRWLPARADVRAVDGSLSQALVDAGHGSHGRSNGVLAAGAAQRC